MPMDLPPGEYPFATHLYDLDDLAVVEASVQLEALIRRTAEGDGVELQRDI